MAILALLGGFYMSLQHEALHGHPTGWRGVNTALAFAPLSLWLPYLGYRSSHMVHHHTDLTDPQFDPESFYLRPVGLVVGRCGQAGYILVTRTMIGRLTIGSVHSIGRYLWRELRTISVQPGDGSSMGGASGRRRPLLGWWLFAVVDIPVWEYVVGSSLMGQSFTLLRSFVEHCAVAEGTRSAVVKAGPVMSLMYLNNNLHHTHHAEPSTPWYALPAAAPADGSRPDSPPRAPVCIAMVTSKWPGATSLRPFCQPDHPLSPGARPFGARGLR